MDYKEGHSLPLAVNSQHNDIRVKISEDCKVDRENPSPSRIRDCDSHSRKRKRNKELRVRPTDVIGASNISTEHEKFKQFSDKKSDKDYDFDLGDTNNKVSLRKRMTKLEDSKRNFRTNGLSKNVK